jgi:hypothetical protein
MPCIYRETECYTYTFSIFGKEAVEGQIISSKGTNISDNVGYERIIIYTNAVGLRDVGRYLYAVT